MRPRPAASVLPARRQLEAIIEDELWRPLPRGLEEAVAQLAEKDGGSSIAAVLFYGSTLRDGNTGDGMVDLYCLVDDLRAFYGHRRFLAWAAALLPPNVSHLVASTRQGKLRAKIAVMSVAQFRWAARHGVGMSIWARFCQPAALCYARDADAATAVREAVADAAVTAVRWAVRSRTEAVATPARLWTDLFRLTYGAELRAEGPSRAATIYGHDPVRYERLLEPALLAGEVGYERADEGIRPIMPPLSAVRRRLRRTAWTVLGKTISILRLCKAAFTFEDGVDYLCWKIERHSGTRVVLTEWQRRHPLLAGPFVAWRLWRRGILK